MSNSKLSDVQLQNILANLTDAMLDEAADVDTLLAQYQIDENDLAGLVTLIDQLNQTLLPVQPSGRFVRRLHQDLIGMEPGNVLGRVRRLPPRVQIAAGIALVAGVMILSRRRANNEAHQEKQERLAAQ